MSAPALISAGAGILSGGKNNKNQQRSANQAGANAQALVKRQADLFDTIMGLAKNNQGALSADGQIASLGKDAAYFSGLERNSTAGAMRTAGYQPGDSEINARQDAIGQKNQRTFASLANQIRVSAPMQQAALYKMADPGSLVPGVQFNQNQQGLALSQMSNPTGFFQAMQPFLGASRRRGFALQGLDAQPGSTMQANGTYGLPLQ